MLPRVGHVNAATEHCYRSPSGVEGSPVCSTVDPVGKTTSLLFAVFVLGA